MKNWNKTLQGDLFNVLEILSGGFGGGGLVNVTMTLIFQRKCLKVPHPLAKFM